VIDAKSRLAAAERARIAQEKRQEELKALEEQKREKAKRYRECAKA